MSSHGGRVLVPDGRPCALEVVPPLEPLAQVVLSTDPQLRGPTSSDLGRAPTTSHRQKGKGRDRSDPETPPADEHRPVFGASRRL
jgi:hypothetical protein